MSFLFLIAIVLSRSVGIDAGATKQRALIYFDQSMYGLLVMPARHHECADEHTPGNSQKFYASKVPPSRF